MTQQPSDQALRGGFTPNPLHDLQLDDQLRKHGVRVLVARSAGAETVFIDTVESHRLATFRSKGPSGDERAIPALAVAQGQLDVKLSLDQGGKRALCDLYFDPSSDSVILRNTASIPIDIRTVAGAKTECYRVNPGRNQEIGVASWTLSIGGREVSCGRILPRTSALVQSPSTIALGVPGPPSAVAYKRSHPPSQDSQPVAPGFKAATAPRRRKTARVNADAIVAFQQSGKPESSQPTLSYLERGAVSGDPSTLRTGQTLTVPAGDGLEQYQITKQDTIASATLSEVYVAYHSRYSKPVVFKVLKTRRRGVPTPTSIIHQADTWLREYNAHKGLDHVCTRFSRL